MFVNVFEPDTVRDPVTCTFEGNWIIPFPEEEIIMFLLLVKLLINKLLPVVYR